MKQTDIETIIKKFKEPFEEQNDLRNHRYASLAYHRYASFDYCYNYFKTTKNLIADTEKSCLVLGFYLASWGMYRGSSFMLQNSVKILEPLIIYFAELKRNERDVWTIDVDKYDDVNIRKILEIYQNIKEDIIPQNQAHLTLVTKILLGVFGFIPAYDNFFCNTFRKITKDKSKCGFRQVNSESLGLIKQFYLDNKDIIDDLSKKTHTIGFDGKETNICYPKVKIIDMYGFKRGENEKGKIKE